MVLRVGIIDSYIAPGGLPLVAARNFCDTGHRDDPSEQPLHGAQIAQLIHSAVPDLQLCAAQVFDRRLSCSPERIARALHWLIEQDVRLVNMSFGLRHDRPALREACEAALAKGVCLVAASPARGDAVYPANYPAVVRATGDARCHRGQISWLRSAQADFGACPGLSQSGLVGASAGCAAVCAALAELALGNPQLTTGQLIQGLADRADYRGPEQRPAGFDPSGVVA